MDLFVLPSRWEGLSLALAEAAGLGLPIVATDVGGNHEVVQPGPGVWFVPPDDPAALAAALTEASREVLVHRRPGQPARYPRPGVRQRFSLSRHVAELDASYRTALHLPPLPQGEVGGEGRTVPTTDTPILRGDKSA
jgi:glycosyltransferase involved in cell wall biosynthesis